jgi:hypothetical protein
LPFICRNLWCCFIPQGKQINKGLSHTLIYIIIGYLLLIALVYLLQERFIFKPEKLHKNFEYKYAAPFKELFFDVEEGVSINGLHFYVEKPLGLVLYFIFMATAGVSKAGQNMLPISFAIIMTWCW